MRGILVLGITPKLQEASRHPGIYVFIGSILVILFILTLVVSKKRNK